MGVPYPVTLGSNLVARCRMSDDRILEFMALMGDYMRNTDRRFEQLITVMHDGFGRLSGQITVLTDEVRGTNQRVDHLTGRVDHLTGRVDHLTGRVDHLTERVDHLTAEVREIKEDVRVLKDDMREVKQDIRDIKAETQTTSRRLSATFDQTGHLTEQTDATALRITHVEQAQQPTNAELHQRLLAVENKLNQAS